MLAETMAENTQRLSLSGQDWFIHDDPDGRGAAERIYEADLSQGGWIPACVPGNIPAYTPSGHVNSPSTSA